MNHPDGNKHLIRPTLTLAMIVRDGGQLFASLLESASRFVDQIVVADTGSGDGSQEIARRKTELVWDQPWTDDFAAARNAALERCTGRWILVLDADEQLTPAGWQELRSWIAEQDEGQEQLAASLPVRSYQSGSPDCRGWQPTPTLDPDPLPEGNPASGYVPASRVRLFPNRPDIRFEGHIFETVEASLRMAGVPVVNLPVTIHHFGMLPCCQSPEVRRVRTHQYLKLARRKASTTPHLPCAWAELADCAIACGNLDQALQAIDRALVLAPVNPCYRLTAGWLLREKGRLDEAERHLSTATGSGPVPDSVLAEISHLRAQIAMASGRSTQAGPLLNLALGLAPENSRYQDTLDLWLEENAAAETECLVPQVT